MSEPTPLRLADQDVRERLLNELDRTFFVEAGAGTGKTTTLVGRIVNLVATGRVTMEHLAAITFTEAAAAELRDRVREGLERAAADPARDEAQQAHCRRAVEEIDLAAISTIHAFAAGLLRTYPLEAGLPPAFATLDEIEQGLLFEERFKAWFWQEALEEPARSLVRRALLLGLTQEPLRELAAALEQQHDLLRPDTTWPAPPAEAALSVAHAVGRHLLELEAWAACADDGMDDPLVQTVAGAQVAARRLAQAETEDEALAALLALGRLDAWHGSAARWGKLPNGRNACAATKQVLREANEAVAEILEAHRAATFAGVLALLRDFVLQGVHQRKADGVATFQDLLAWARDLLRDHAEARRRAQARFQRIFVDEFQDTDPLQAEIAFYLAADEQDGQPLPDDWRDIRPVPGKLFLVGDPKQSIYRFRRADITVYDDLLERLRDTREHLVQNFRSVRPVLEWVNHHFDQYMQAEHGVQPAYVPLAVRWDAFDADGRCGVYRVGGQLDGSADEAAQVEAETLAKLARAAVEEGWLVADRASDGERVVRPATYRDLCILLPTRTHLRRLERAFEVADIPYRVEAGKLVLATQEVRDLLACLRAIEDPSDQVALVAALRSPAYACSDVDLLQWAEGGGRLDHEHPGAGPDGSVKAALAHLASFHARRHRLSPPALIEAFIRDRLLVAAAFGEPRPREAWRRLRYVVSRARAFTGTGRHTLRAFLDWIEGLQRAEVRDSERGSAESDEDALQIQTIHGAKGLEYPIVLLGGLGTHGRRFGGTDVIADRRTGRLACSAGRGWQTDDYPAARAHEHAMAEAEAVRLLYVATTRARDHLVLSLFRGAKATDCAAALIEHHLARSPELCHPLAVPADPIRHGDPPGDALDPRADHVDLSEAMWAARRAECVQRLACAPALDVDFHPWLAATEMGEPTAAGGDDHDRVRALVRRDWARGGLVLADGEDEQVVAQARAILASETVQAAQASRRCRRDVSVLARVDGVTLDLVADVVYETDGGAVLVLYDLGNRGEPALQDACVCAGLLALAFEQATGRRPQAVQVVRAADGGSTHVVNLEPQLAQARDMLRCLARAELSGPAPQAGDVEASSATGARWCSTA